MEPVHGTKGDRIKEAIKKSGLKQTYIATALDVTEGTIVNYIKGRRDISDESLRIIAELTKVSFEWLKTGVLKPANEAHVPYSTQTFTYEMFTDVFSQLQKVGKFAEIGLIGGLIARFNALLIENERLQSELNALKMQNSETQTEEPNKARATSA
ncbi:MAG: helix-turn-helix transcriptional regulator [Bacteroidota bacterium]